MDKLPKVRRSLYTIFVKRILDIAISGVAILLLSPLLLIISALEMLIHGWPIIFSQERPGLHGNVFKIYKFRSMTNDKNAQGELLPGEQRITRFGHFLRRFSLDELPELFCVFTGKMSLIGPRPLLVKYLPLYTKRHMMRHEVRPGFACVPLQEIHTWTWNDQFENDIWYIENCSLLVDLKMIFRILKEVIVGSDYRVEDTRGEFSGDNLYYDAKSVK